jgi:signal transduction histidine kinase
MTASNPQAPIRVVRSLLQGSRQPVPEFVHRALRTLMEELEARCVFLARLDDLGLEVVDVVSAGGPAPERGLRLPAGDRLAAPPATAKLVNLRDASRDQAGELSLPERLQVTSYLGVPLLGPSSQATWGTLNVLGKTPRAFQPAEIDLVEVVAGILATRLDSDPPPRQAARAPLSAVRMASEEVKEPLAILRGYADMLSRQEVPATELAVVAERLAAQSETVIRVVDHVLLLARFPLELSFTVRVALGAVVRSVADRSRGSVSAKGMELRLQLDAEGDVWGDPALLEAAVEEMVVNVLRHAPSANVIQLRVRRSHQDRFQVLVKDDGPGISADRLAQLFAETEEAGEPPLRGHGVGLYLLRRVAEAHGGSAWANSLEGKGTTFYLELPAASPDGEAVRASSAAPAPA